MDKKKNIKIHNQSSKPDNVVLKKHEIEEACGKIEEELPSFLAGFFDYLDVNVLPMTKLAYLHDINFFCKYLIEDTDLTHAEKKRDIKLADFQKIVPIDVNLFLKYCRHYEKETKDSVYTFENNNKTLARKKSSLSVMFKELCREGLLEKNIADEFDPIRVQKAQDREIKYLSDDEVMIMLDAVTTGSGLTDKEHQYWEKTKKRDKAILVLFVTYGLRLSELQQLNVSSFNFSRGEFLIYRKRDKEASMPLNDSVTMVVKDYIENERLDDEKIKEDAKDALFLSLRGTRMTARQIRTLVKKYTSIGMGTSRRSGYSPHKLRATAATSLIGRGNSIYDVAALLDHEQVTTTQLYARQRMGTKRDLVRNMEWEVERKETENNGKENKDE